MGVCLPYLTSDVYLKRKVSRVKYALFRHSILRLPCKNVATSSISLNLLSGQSFDSSQLALLHWLDWADGQCSVVSLPD